jgi:hypothetical protein
MAVKWSAVEWQLYLESLPRPLPLALCAEIDGRFELTDSKNYDVAVTWLERGVEAGYEPAITRAGQVVAEVGRMKYLRPLYGALAARAETASLALDLFRGLRDRYHPIAQATVERVLREAGLAVGETP